MMKIFKSIKKKAASFWVNSATSLPNGWHGFGGSDAGEIVTEKRLLGLSAVWACVSINARTIASLPVKVLKPSENGGPPVADDQHWLNRLFNSSPNADQSPMDFIEFIQASLEIRGNAYCKIERNARNEVIALLPLMPDNVSVKRVKGRGLIYTVIDEMAVQKEFNPDQIFHIRGMGGNPLGGLSPLAYGREVFGLALAISKSAAKTFKNGLRPSGTLSFEDFVEDDDRNRIYSAIEKQYSGALNSGKPMILEGGSKWTQISLSPEDSQLLESRVFSVEEACRFFDVPPIIIGLGGKVSNFGTGVLEITLGWVKFSLTPRVRRIEQAIKKQLLTPADRANGITVKLSLEGLLRGAPQQRAEFYAKMTQAGVMTVNECRALENLQPVAGGDTPHLQSQNIPLSELTISMPSGQNNGDGNAQN